MILKNFFVFIAMKKSTTHKAIVSLIHGRNYSKVIPLEDLVDRTKTIVDNSESLKSIALARYGSPLQRLYYGLTLLFKGKKNDLGSLARSQYKMMSELSDLSKNLYAQLENAYHEITARRDAKLQAPVEIYQELKGLREKLSEFNPKMENLKTEFSSGKYSIENEPEVYSEKNQERVLLQRKINEILAKYDVKTTEANLVQGGDQELEKYETYTLNTLTVVGKICAFLMENTDRLETYSNGVDVFSRTNRILEETLTMVGKINGDSNRIMQEINQDLLALPQEFKREQLISLPGINYR